MTPTIVVHGGAGGVADERIPAVRAGCEAAVRAGLRVLAEGGGALDAVQAAARVLEDDPEFNAGVGAALTREGTVELDAAIMDGATLRLGGVGAVENLRRPVDLARAVLEDGEHVLLVGDAAWAFARERGFAPVEAAEMITERARKHLADERARRLAGQPAQPLGGGTVGACAIDARGHVAAATSTGGITYKRRGRVGDTPLAGCGTYADDRGGAASATGIGETIVRVTMTRFCVDRLRAGESAAAAAWAAVDELGERVGGSGGIICVDAAGRVGLAHNTPRMSWAWGTVGGEPVSGVVATRDGQLR